MRMQKLYMRVPTDLTSLTLTKWNCPDLKQSPNKFVQVTETDSLWGIFLLDPFFKVGQSCWVKVSSAGQTIRWVGLRLWDLNWPCRNVQIWISRQRVEWRKNKIPAWHSDYLINCHVKGKSYLYILHITHYTNNRITKYWSIQNTFSNCFI